MALPSLILFARAPEPGRVKTRLAPLLTERGAADLYRAFLEDAARVYASTPRWQSVVCVDGDSSDRFFSAPFATGWRFERQVAGDLGERLLCAFEEEFRRGAPAAVAVGSDHPALPRRRVEEALEALGAGTGASLIPAADGGYCAIGLSSGLPLADVFRGVAWSTEAVLAQTVSRLERAGIGYRLLSPAYDVDRPEDLRRLRADLAGRDAAAADYPSATARALAALDRVTGRPS